MGFLPLFTSHFRTSTNIEHGREFNFATLGLEFHGRLMLWEINHVGPGFGIAVSYLNFIFASETSRICQI